MVEKEGKLRISHGPGGGNASSPGAVAVAEDAGSRRKRQAEERKIRKSGGKASKDAGSRTSSAASKTAVGAYRGDGNDAASRRKRQSEDRKNRASRSAGRPSGAALSASEREQRKMQRNKAGKLANSGASGYQGSGDNAAPGDSDALEIDATVVDDAAREERLEKLKAEMNDFKTTLENAQRRKNESPLPLLDAYAKTDEEAGQVSDENMEEEKKESCCWRNRCFILLMLLLLIGGAAAAWWFLFRKDDAPENLAQETKVPSAAPSQQSDAPTNSMVPSSSPTASIQPTIAPTPFDRLAALENLLADLLPLNQAVLNFLVNDDQWMPSPDANNQEVQWRERYAVLVIFYALDGDKWGTNSGWATSASVCDDWFGITKCGNAAADGDDKENVVVALSLRGNNLQGTIPTEIGLLSNLENLFLDQNPITGTIPSEIGNLKNIKQLKLDNNQLKGEIPPEVFQLSGLTWLDFANNVNIVGTLPTEIGNLSKLQRFDVISTDMDGALPSEVGLLTDMERMYISTTRINGTIPTEIGNLVNLKTLDIAATALEGTIPTEIGKLQNLERLWAGAAVALEGQIPTQVGRMTSLVELELFAAKFSGSIPTEIGLATGLTILQFNVNKITGTIPSEIGKLNQLEVLRLDSNRLSGAIPLDIFECSALTSLYLATNFLNGEVPPLPNSLLNPDPPKCSLDLNCFSDASNALSHNCKMEQNNPGC